VSRGLRDVVLRWPLLVIVMQPQMTAGLPPGHTIHFRRSNKFFLFEMLNMRLLHTFWYPLNAPHYS